MNPLFKRISRLVLIAAVFMLAAATSSTGEEIKLTTIMPSIPTNNMMIDASLVYTGRQNYFSGVMIAASPLTNKVYARSTFGTTGTPTGTPRDHLGLSTKWSDWDDFGTPDANSTIVGVSVSLVWDGSVDLCSGIICARMSSGDVYVRAISQEQILHIGINNKWSAWDNPGANFGTPE